MYVFLYVYTFIIDLLLGNHAYIFSKIVKWDKKIDFAEVFIIDIFTYL